MILKQYNYNVVEMPLKSYKYVLMDSKFNEPLVLILGSAKFE